MQQLVEVRRRLEIVRRRCFLDYWHVVVDTGQEARQVVQIGRGKLGDAAPKSPKSQAYSGLSHPKVKPVRA
jgi:hypothetical protein